MAGSKAAAQKAKAKNIERFGADYYAQIGAEGGRQKNPKKGFGTAGNSQKANKARWDKVRKNRPTKEKVE